MQKKANKTVCGKEKGHKRVYTVDSMQIQPVYRRQSNKNTVEEKHIRSRKCDENDDNVGGRGDGNNSNSITRMLFLQKKGKAYTRTRTVNRINGI